jgi:type IV pilus secretin PilQ/predicted competence protein
MTVKIHTSLLTFGALTVSLAFAQDTPPVQPIEPPIIQPAAPAGDLGATPAPIAPPIDTLGTPGITPAPGVGAPPPEFSAPPQLPGVARTSEFQGDEIGLVLRTLARQAQMNIVVSDKVSAAAGTVTMRIENKTPREAVEIIVRSKGLIMDETDGVSYIKTQEEKQKEPAISAHYTFSYAQGKNVSALLQSQLQSGLAPQVDERTNTIFYRETESNMAKIQEFLVSVDRPTQQVMIEARLVEVNANPRQSYGINWGGVVGGFSTPQTFRYGGSNPAEPPTFVLDANGIPRETPGKPAAFVFDQQTGQLNSRDFFLNGQTTGGFLDVLGSQFAILSVPQMSATLRLLNEDRDAEFIANPRIVTANNQKAEIKITRNQPVPQLNFNEQTAQAVFSGFQDKEFGNTLTVTPIINKDSFVTLNVKPEISNKVADATFVFSGAVVTSPVIDKRVLESNVLIKSGDTLAIGGLLQDESGKSTSKVPVLGDIPLIGYLFQEKVNERSKRNLLVFVTPTVIKQGYGTGLEGQVSGLTHSGDEYADPNGWRNNAKGAVRVVPTSNRQLASDYPKPGVAKPPKKVGYKVNATARE